MRVRMRGNKVVDVQLKIYEPPRFFEAFLRGRQFTEAPDITARICRSAGRLPDGRLPGDGVRLRGRGERAAARAAPAPLLRRVDRVAHAAHL